MGNILITGFGSTVDLDVVTAEAGDIIAGKVIVDKNGNPLKGTLSLSGNAGAGDVRKGKTFYSTNPKSKQAGTMAEKGAATYTPGTSNQVIAANQYLTGAQTILGDADLIAANIVSGKNIFGVAGSARKYGSWSGKRSSGSSTKYFEGDFSYALPYIQFAPGFIPTHVTANLDTDARVYSYYTSYGQFILPGGSVKSTMTSSELIIPVPRANATYNVLVVGYY